MMNEAAKSDVVLDIVNQWLNNQADVIPIVPGHNVLIKHPNDIRSVLTSRNYTKEPVRTGISEPMLPMGSSPHPRSAIDATGWFSTWRPKTTSFSTASQWSKPTP